MSYNYDRWLNLHLAFNRVYRNDNASLFQEIFWVYLEGKRVDYSITWNNSVTYALQAYPIDTSLAANLTVICRFP